MKEQKEQKEQPPAEELEAVRSASDRIRALEQRLREENVRIYVSFDAGGVLLAWVEEQVSGKWRIMSLAPEQEAARPLQTQPSAIRIQVQSFLDGFETRLRAVMAECVKLGGNPTPRPPKPAVVQPARPRIPSRDAPRRPRPLGRRPPPRGRPARKGP
jgi:hypothetical protein